MFYNPGKRYKFSPLVINCIASHLHATCADVLFTRVSSFHENPLAIDKQTPFVQLETSALLSKTNLLSWKLIIHELLSITSMEIVAQLFYIFAYLGFWLQWWPESVFMTFFDVLLKRVLSNFVCDLNITLFGASQKGRPKSGGRGGSAQRGQSKYTFIVTMRTRGLG